MSFSKLIKRYKYIGGFKAETVRPEKIVKKGRFQVAELPDFKRPSGAAQKKKRECNPVPADGSVNDCASSINSPSNNSTIIEYRYGDPVLSSNQEARTDDVIESAKKAAHAAGFQEGRSQGLAEVSARVEKIKSITDKMMGELNASSKNFFDEFEKTLTDLSLHLAARIIGEAAYTLPEVVRSNVEKCLGLLAGAGNVIIKINPGDYEVIKELLPNLERKFDGHFSYMIEPDQKISRGGCLIEMDGSVIDGRIETQFHKLKEEMQQLT